VAMNAAQPRKLGAFEAWNGPKDAQLLAMLQLGLEPDHVPQGAKSIVLAKLDYRIGPAPGARIVESDPLHRAIAQRFDAAFGHDLDRHAALEIGRIPFPVLELGFFPLVQREDEGFILLLRHRAIDIVLALALVPPRL